VSRLIGLERLGQVYVGWFAGDAEGGNAPLELWRTGGEWSFTWRALHVIVSPPSVGWRLELRRNGPQLRVV
jgi:hypothetical protein